MYSDSLCLLTILSPHSPALQEWPWASCCDKGQTAVVQTFENSYMNIKQYICVWLCVKSSAISVPRAKNDEFDFDKKITLS